VGQAVCDDPIDDRHKAIVPPRLWGDGDAEGVRQRAAEEMKDTARAGAKLGVNTVVGFTGSKIWKTLAMFPPAPTPLVHHRDRGCARGTALGSREARGNRQAFGRNGDPSHFVWQALDPGGFLWDFRDRIYHV